MFFSPSQIRAARALLNWSAEELGTRVGVTKTMISAIETGRSSGSAEVLKNIFYTFRAAGVDLTEDGGIIPNINKILTFRGHSRFCAFFDDVYDVARADTDPNICVINSDDNLFLKWHGSHAPAHMRRMSALKINPARTLMSSKNSLKVANEYSIYKWTDQPISFSSCLYLYGHKAGIINFKETDVEITLVNNESTVEIFRSMFDFLWSKALS